MRRMRMRTNEGAEKVGCCIRGEMGEHEKMFNKYVRQQKDEKEKMKKFKENKV